MILKNLVVRSPSVEMLRHFAVPRSASWWWSHVEQVPAHSGFSTPVLPAAVF